MTGAEPATGLGLGDHGHAQKLAGASRQIGGDDDPAAGDGIFAQFRQSEILTW